MRKYPSKERVKEVIKKAKVYRIVRDKKMVGKKLSTEEEKIWKDYCFGLGEG